MSDSTVKVSRFQKFWKALAQLFKNTSEQFSIEEVCKFAAFVAAVLLAYFFFLTNKVPADARSYFLTVEGALLGYALAQSISHNVTKQ
jgi:hypothetical protein